MRQCSAAAARFLGWTEQAAGPDLSPAASRRPRCRPGPRRRAPRSAPPWRSSRCDVHDSTAAKPKPNRPSVSARRRTGSRPGSSSPTSTASRSWITRTSPLSSRPRSPVRMARTMNEYSSGSVSMRSISALDRGPHDRRDRHLTAEVGGRPRLQAAGEGHGDGVGHAPLVAELAVEHRLADARTPGQVVHRQVRSPVAHRLHRGLDEPVALLGPLGGGASGPTPSTVGHHRRSCHVREIWQRLRNTTASGPERPPPACSALAARSVRRQCRPRSGLATPRAGPRCRGRRGGSPCGCSRAAGR